MQMVSQPTSEIDQIKTCVKIQSTLIEGIIATITTTPTPTRITHVVGWTYQSQSLLYNLSKKYGEFGGLTEAIADHLQPSLPGSPLTSNEKWDNR